MAKDGWIDAQRDEVTLELSRARRHVTDLERAVGELRDAVRAEPHVDAEGTDAGVLDVELATESGLLRAARQVADALDEALVRLERGVYESCARCGGQIGRERLEALPRASQCVSCASRRD